MANKVEYISYAVQVKEAIQEATEVALLATGILVKAEAKLLAPVGKIQGGTLKKSIDYQVEEDRVLVGSYAEYSVYVEKGTGIYAEDGDGRKTPWVYYDNLRNQYVYTVGQQPQPFIMPAIMNNRDKITEIFEKELMKLGNQKP